jgi:hypothetical protein
MYVYMDSTAVAVQSSSGIKSQSSESQKMFQRNILLPPSRMKSEPSMKSA